MRAEKIPREERFTEFYRAYVDEIYRFLFLRSGMDASVAEELTQEVFVEAFRGFAGFEGRSSERTWVFGIARNRLGDFYRKSYRPLLRCENIDDLQPEDPLQDVERLQLVAFERESVRAALAALPAQYAAALTLKYIDEMSTKEIARLAGRTPKAAESLLARAKRAFAKEYEKISEREEL